VAGKAYTGSAVHMSQKTLSGWIPSHAAGEAVCFRFGVIEPILRPKFFGTAPVSLSGVM
jgi:hypothetical protein